MPQQVLALPLHIATQLPAFSLLRDTLLANVIELRADHLFYRGAWNQASVWPRQASATHRFGPPEVLRDSSGVFPFHWIYMADHVVTAAWEARFCVNDVTRPGTFYIPPNAADALVALLLFGQPIRLLDLTGTVASKLGLYGQVNSPDQELCQWLGCLLDQVIVAAQGSVHGIRYPSRRHPGFHAYAISSRVMDVLSGLLSHSATEFRHTAEFAQLTKDRCCVPPP